MQVILGSGGSIGIELAKALQQHTEKLRLVSRNPQRVNDSDELFKADLTLSEDVLEAVEGADVAYLTVGLQYKAAVWEIQWPAVMRNVIDACKQHKCKLVFFDNVYMYDPQYMGNIHEDTPVNPKSKKGKVRAHIAQLILDQVLDGSLTALIARSADFYGPGIEKNGMIRELIFNKIANGEKANWLGSLDKKHSVTYTPDAAHGTALLGNTEDAFNQVWHLPTASDPMTGRQWIQTVADGMHVKPKMQVAPKFLVKVLGWFDPLMAELPEMMYQYDQDYVFNSRKFEDRFGFEPTPYHAGIKEVIESDFNGQ